MVNIDMWYGNKASEADNIFISFNGYTGLYVGWIYKDKKIIGDFSTPDSIALEKAFPQLVFNWN